LTADEAALALIDALERARVPYMVVGSLASNFHGIPRATRDADFVVEMGSGSIDALAAALPPELFLRPQSSVEAITGTMRHIVELRGSAFVGELFSLSDDPHDRERFARRRQVGFLGRSASVASAEDMVVTKLLWSQRAGRAKDLDDARNILAVRRDDLDRDYLLKWCPAHGTLDQLQRLRASIPPD
jgi:hypothetical protein